MNKLLVANRGEIAVRVIRTARDMGIRTVAVFSEADADALHVRLADEAVLLGEADVNASYLDVAKILDAATRTDADAVHPGYGFLSENAGFARACTSAGLVFVGPPADAIDLMGDKARAKARMIESGVPCVPGFQGDNPDDATLTAKADGVGFPLLVKAAAGGGGRGMRVVREASELAQALVGARTEAQNAFGNGALLLERLVEGARHVEIQVFADTHGEVLHLGERECSVQRRHQKVIEEAPSPAVDEELRARMGAAAVEAARSIGYQGAGTVEFLLDADKNFYFLEMNTRLQVEHPVTELVTGLDLVELQLLVAAGEPLGFEQEDVELVGHAMEVRLYAEDPYAGFLPQTGRIEAFVVPDREGIRIDTGVVSGAEVSAHYDPMLAKIIAHGESRSAARRRLRSALLDTAVLGVTTNRDFLLELLVDPAFVAGEMTTQTLDRRPMPTAAERAPQALAWAVAAALRGETEAAHGSWALELRADAEPATVHVEVSGGRWQIRHGEETVELALERRDGDIALVTTQGVRRRVPFALGDEAVFFTLDERTYSFSEVAASSQVAAVVSDGTVRAPTSGKVLRVDVAPGARVEAGDTLVVLEAMKMEHRVQAPISGTVAHVGVAAGDQVKQRDILIKVEESQA